MLPISGLGFLLEEPHNAQMHLTRQPLLMEGRLRRFNSRRFMGGSTKNQHETGKIHSQLPAVTAKIAHKLVRQLRYNDTPENLAYRPPQTRGGGRVNQNHPHPVGFKDEHSVPMGRTLRFLERTGVAAGGAHSQAAHKVGVFRMEFKSRGHADIAHNRIRKAFGHGMEMERFDPEGPSGSHDLEVSHHHVHKAVVDRLSLLNPPPRKGRAKRKPVPFNLEWVRTPLLALLLASAGA